MPLTSTLFPGGRLSIWVSESFPAHSARRWQNLKRPRVSLQAHRSLLYIPGFPTTISLNIYICFTIADYWLQLGVELLQPRQPSPVGDKLPKRRFEGSGWERPIKIRSRSHSHISFPVFCICPRQSSWEFAASVWASARVLSSPACLANPLWSLPFHYFNNHPSLRRFRRQENILQKDFKKRLSG